MPEPLPAQITDEPTLDTLLSFPTPELVAAVRQWSGDLIILGIAGKMGVSLGRMAARAVAETGVRRRVIGVARFSSAEARAQLDTAGVETIACDLLNPDAVAALPRAENVLYMAGRKFGTGQDAALTWAMNTIAPANVARHFAGSRIVAFSTGCVYPLVPANGANCTEADPPNPVGEYAQSCLGRERIFEYYSRITATPVCLFRLNYAIDLRYGVLHDLAQRIWQGEPVDLAVPRANVIWQGDANAFALRALDCCTTPATPLNVTGPETISIRETALTLGELLRKPVVFAGSEGTTAYLNDAARALQLFGPLRVNLAQMLAWTAHWVRAGGRSLQLPTHFEVTTGSY